MDQSNLVATLIAQHRVLQTDLGLALAGAQSETDQPADEILAELNKFKKDLTGHLALENDVFYPALLKQMKERGNSTENTEKFISEMDTIAKVVVGFLTKYNSTTAILENKAVFGEELDNIIKTLNIRIESEEDGIFPNLLAS